MNNRSRNGNHNLLASREHPGVHAGTPNLARTAVEGQDSKMRRSDAHGTVAVEVADCSFRLKLFSCCEDPEIGSVEGMFSKVYANGQWRSYGNLVPTEGLVL